MSPRDALRGVAPRRARIALHIPPAAVGMILVAVLCFSILDSFVKVLAARYPVPLLVWARYGVQALAMLVWWGPKLGTNLVRTRRPVFQLVRGGVLVFSSVLFVTALRYLPLADATAINFSAPTLVVLLAFFVLHERLTRPRLAFIAAGLVGMVLIVRPGASLFQGASLLAIGAAGCYATFQILTRKLAGEDSRVLLFYPALVGTIGMAVLALPWLPRVVPWQDLLMIVVGGLFGTVGHFLFILAFQRAPASGLTPFTYMQLVWATLLGFLLFGDFPAPLTLIGMAVVSVSGLLLTFHERRQALATVAAPTTID